MFTKRVGTVPSAARPAGIEGLRRGIKGCLNLAGIVVGAVVVFCAFAAPVGEKLAAADRAAIETTIRQQLDAFAAEDADRAFAFATPEIQRQFGNAGRFLQTVRDQYDAVYHPGSVHFGRLALVDGDWVQTVQVADQEGRVWRALFTMRRQPDRGWKVGGCQLIETNALST